MNMRHIVATHCIMDGTRRRRSALHHRNVRIEMEALAAHECGMK